MAKNHLRLGGVVARGLFLLAFCTVSTMGASSARSEEQALLYEITWHALATGHTDVTSSGVETIKDTFTEMQGHAVVRANNVEVLAVLKFSMSVEDKREEVHIGQCTDPPGTWKSV